MKTLFLILTLFMINFMTKAQSELRDSLQLDSTLTQFYNEFSSLGQIPDILPCKYNDLKLRGRLQLIFKNKKYWNEFTTNRNGKYYWIQAPETEWYDSEFGPKESNKNSLIIGDPVMVDSTVIKYYNAKIKGYKFDSFKYEIIEQPEFGTTQEYYTFYKDRVVVRYFMVGWNGTEYFGFSEQRREGEK